MASLPPQPPQPPAPFKWPIEIVADWLLQQAQSVFQELSQLTGHSVDECVTEHQQARDYLYNSVHGHLDPVQHMQKSIRWTARVIMGKKFYKFC